MKQSFAEYQQQNPLRPVDWRWQRAEELFAKQERLRPHHDDPTTRDAVRYLRERAGGHPERAARRYPAIDQAWSLRGDECQRISVESQLLARQPAEEIARAANLTPEIVDACEALFFSVRDRLNARTWVLTQAIGRVENATTERSRHERLIKLLAYFGGPAVLDITRDHFGLHAGPLGGDPADRGPDLLGERIEVLKMLLSGPIPVEAALETSEIWREVSMSPPADLEALICWPGHANRAGTVPG